MTVAVVKRWGGELAVPIPESIAGGLAEGESVEVVDAGGDIVIRRLPFSTTAEQMFAGQTDEAWRTLYAGAYYWGPDVGRERID